ncbi:MAG: hypothetical protein ABSH44_17535 [Bryobacteraceae bacterium]|jgi:hypothetical protein
MQKTPSFHEGAEMERRAFKAFLKREIKIRGNDTVVTAWAQGALEWVQGRCDRYKKRKGGL